MVTLKKLRKSRDITQSELSKILGVSPSTIGMYEQGRREPDKETLLKLAKFFNVTTDYLLGNDKPHQEADRPAAKKLKQELQLDAQDMELIKAFVQLSPEQRKKGVDFIKALSSNVVDIMPSAQTAAAPPDAGRPDGLTDEEWNIVQMLRLEEEESSASLSSVSAKRA